TAACACLPVGHQVAEIGQAAAVGPVALGGDPVQGARGQPGLGVLVAGQAVVVAAGVAGVGAGRIQAQRRGAELQVRVHAVDLGVDVAQEAGDLVGGPVVEVQPVGVGAAG